MSPETPSHSVRTPRRGPGRCGVARAEPSGPHPLPIPFLSRAVGQQLVTLYVVGRRTRRIYAVPVAYTPQAGQLVIGTTSGWARNLRSGEPIEIRLKGRRRWAAVEIFTAVAASGGSPDVLTRVVLVRR